MGKETEIGTVKKVIKRYPNRKLYDLDRSCYVNLDDMAEMIRSGVEVQVVDHKSGDDVTGMVLAQILYEEEKNKESRLPKDFMQRLIRAGEENIGHFLSQLRGRVEQPMQTIHAIRDEVEQRAKRLMELGQLTREEGNRFLTQWLDTTTHSLEEWQKRVDNHAVEVFDKVTGIASYRQDLTKLLEQLTRLEQRVADVEKQLQRIVKTKKK